MTVVEVLFCRYCLSSKSSFTFCKLRFLTLRKPKTTLNSANFQSRIIGLFCRYARSQNAHLRRVNSAFSSFASLKLTQFCNFVPLANDCCGSVILSFWLESFEENLGNLRSLGKMLCVTLNTLNSLKNKSCPRAAFVVIIDQVSGG